MKKLLLTALIASLLVIPFEGTALALPGEASASKQTLDYSPGDIPAQTDAVEAMSPALHALVLSMDHQEASTFDRSNRELAWESLYNFLSLSTGRWTGGWSWKMICCTFLRRPPRITPPRWI